MSKNNNNLPRGLYRDEDGGVGLIRCPKCNKENYAINVTLGICTWCGYNANKEYKQEKNADNESKRHYSDRQI